MRKNRKSAHRKKDWVCPYFKWDGKACVSCSAGIHDFPSEYRANEYMTAYCAGRWRECSIAKEWNEYFERWEDIDEKDRALYMRYKQAGHG